MHKVTVPWVEHIDNTSPRAYDFQKDNSRSTMVVDVLAADLPVFVYQVLGYTTRPAPGALSRWTPARHPAWPWHFCTQISNVQGIIHRKANQQSDLGTIMGKFVPIARYQRERCTLLFQTLPYDIRDDTYIYGGGRTEFSRYVLKIPAKPNVRVLTINPGENGVSFKYAEPPASDQTNASIPFGVGQFIPEYDLTWEWQDLPEAAIMAANGIPTNIQTCLGNVNNAEFAGFPAGTLLLLGAEIIPEVSPIQPTILGLGPLDIPRTYRVRYTVKYFGYGHNRAPWRADMRWYLITTTGTADGATLYQKVDFNLLFRPL